MVRPQFAKLDVGTIKLRDGFSLDTLALEGQMRPHSSGIEISQFGPINPTLEEHCKKFVPFFPDPDLGEGKRLRLVEGFSGPCSMLVNSTEELAEHMSNGYQVAYYNYLLGKGQKLGGSFPKYCCLMASS